MIFRKNNINSHILYLQLLILLVGLANTSVIAQQKQPNIVYILMDDVGWKDLGSYGSDYYETPNLDKLAERGIRFTDSYAYPQCSPSRFALFTGQNPARAGLTHAIIPFDHKRDGPKERVHHPRSAWPLADPAILDKMPSEIQTLPELLRSVGYATAMFGKWHLGTMEEDPPTKHGFDVYFGGAESGPRSYFSPYELEYLEDGPKGEHVDDRLTSEAIGYLKKHQEEKPNEPFFVTMTYYDVHSPWQAKKNLIDYFTKKIDLNNRQTNPVYASMIKTVDTNIGKLISFVEEEYTLENTIIIISSDNGGLKYINGLGRGMRGPYPIGTKITSNEPLRGGKSTIYEGGIRVPTIVLWPNGRSGVVEDTPIAIWDWMPTLLNAAGVKRPKQQGIDGLSLLSLIKNGEDLPERSLYWHFPHYQIGPSPDGWSNPNITNRPNTTIRQGDMKLIYHYGAPPELYNIKKDIREQTDLAKKRPEIMKKLSNEILNWTNKIDAYLPHRNINYEPNGSY